MSMFPLTALYKESAGRCIALATGIKESKGTTFLIFDKSILPGQIQLDAEFEKVVQYIQDTQKQAAPYIDFTGFQHIVKTYLQPGKPL